MDTQTGALRGVQEGEELPDLGQVMAEVQEGLRSRSRVPPEVRVPESFLPLTPQQRLAVAFGAVRGKDRAAAHRGQRAKAKAKRRKRR